MFFLHKPTSHFNSFLVKIHNKFPPPLFATGSASPAILTVSELNNTAAKILERNFPLLWISGEISNFTKAASGHWYFTLKDDSAQVRAVMFRGRALLADFVPRNGDKVEVLATVSLYTARGDFQLNVEAIRHAGVGNLYEAFLHLKSKLEKEGLFDIGRKRPLPFFARTIGIVTSPKAAALRDVLTTLGRRAPHVRLILYPTPVQGQGSAEKIAHAISTASLRAECDILLICRGGGSIEDLWSFNEETVARAIAACSLPVISGIGHETDFTIADFVADLRAPTPTGAAEIATRAYDEWIDLLGSHAEKMQYAMKRLLNNSMQKTDGLARRLISPSAYIERERIKLHSTTARLARVSDNLLVKSRYETAHWNTRIRAQLPDVAQWQDMLSNTGNKLARAMAAQFERRQQTVSSLASQLELLNPERTLERGYAILTDPQGKIIRSPAQLPVRKPISVKLASGSAKISVESVQPDLE